MIRVHDRLAAQALELGPDPRLVVAEYDHDAVDTGTAGGPHDAPYERFALDLEEQLVPAHPRGRARGEHDGGDVVQAADRLAMTPRM